MATSKSTTDQAQAANHSKEDNMATETSKMTPEEKIAYAQSLMEEAKADGQKMFDDTINFLAEKLKKMGRSKLDAMGGLYMLMSVEEQKQFVAKFKEITGGITGGARKPRAAKGSKPAKEYKDKDGTGSRPEPGKTYVLNGVEWTKAANGLGAAKKEFIDAIQHGATWSELAAK